MNKDKQEVREHTRNGGKTTIQSLKRKRKEELEGMESIQHQPNVKKANFSIKDNNELQKIKQNFPLALVKCEFSGENNNESADVEIDFGKCQRILQPLEMELKRQLKNKIMIAFR